MTDSTTPTEKIIGWLDALDPETRGLLLAGMLLYTPYEWTRGLNWKLALEEPVQWWGLLRERLQQLTEDPGQNLGIALSLQALITYAFGPLEIDIETQIMGYETMPIPEDIREQAIARIPLDSRRKQRNHENWLKFVSEHLDAEDLRLWFASGLPAPWEKEIV